MADKIKIDRDDDYVPTDSEDDFDEEEKELIDKVRQKRNRDDGDGAVFGFDEDDSEDDEIGASDIEDGGDYDGVPDEKAWGKNRFAYYNTDFVDQDYSTYNEKEQEQAQAEEEEAKAIQQRLAKQLDEADFSLDIYSEPQPEPTEQEVSNKTKLKADFSQLSARQKQQLFEKDSPEFAGLVHDFEKYLLESETVLSPILKYADEQNLQLPTIDFVRTKNNLILTYCTNVGFYLIMKSKRAVVKSHPVVKRLVQLRQLLLQLEDSYQGIVKPQLEKLIDAMNSGAEFTVRSTVDALVKPIGRQKKKRLNALKFTVTEEEADQDSDYDSRDDEGGSPTKEAGSSTDDESDVKMKSEGEADEEEDDDERRGITYQMAKNKGLTPHRKKELRNPRVKHRNKYRKALIRRKGAVRTVRTEVKRYGGEISGIKASVKKGINLKS